MEKKVYALPPYRVDAKNHSYASYCYLRQWLNRGEFLEVAYKAQIMGDVGAKSARAYNAGADLTITDRQGRSKLISVKSNNASLAQFFHIDNKDALARRAAIARFFAAASFDEVHYLVIDESKKRLICYEMNKKEAQEFFNFCISWRLSGESEMNGLQIYKPRISFSDQKAQKLLDGFVQKGYFTPPKTGKIYGTEGRTRNTEKMEKRRQELEEVRKIIREEMRDVLREQLMAGLDYLNEK